MKVTPIQRWLTLVLSAELPGASEAEAHVTGLGVYGTGFGEAEPHCEECTEQDSVRCPANRIR
jgi:hypothetical protein